MAQDDERRLITPPPGLLPPRPKPDTETPVDTGSETRKVAPRRAPTFFPATPGTAPPGPAESDDADAAAPDAADVATGETPVLDETVQDETVHVERTTVAHTGTVVSWTLVFPDGSLHTVEEAGIVLGRNPSAPESAPDAQPVQVLDPERSVSKTHALVRVQGAELRVVDLSSTNGTRVGDERTPVPTEAPDGLAVPDGSVVALGEFELRVRRGRRLG